MPDISPELQQVWEEKRREYEATRHVREAAQVQENIAPLPRSLSSLAAPFLARLDQSIQARRERRAKLEKEHPHVTCYECFDSGGVMFAGSDHPCPWCEKGRELERNAKQAKIEEWRYQVDHECGIPRIYRPYSFERCDLEKSSPPLSSIRAWVRDVPKNPYSLYLYGAFGRGKSGLAAIALREVIWKVGEWGQYQYPPRHYGEYLTVASLLQSLRPHGPTDTEPQKKIERYQRLPFLVLDDFGSERLTAWGAEQVYELVNERDVHMRPMIVTSNLSLDKLADKINHERELLGTEMGTRIVERLRESCQPVEFPASLPNWRYR